MWSARVLLSLRRRLNVLSLLSFRSKRQKVEKLVHSCMRFLIGASGNPYFLAKISKKIATLKGATPSGSDFWKKVTPFVQLFFLNFPKYWKLISKIWNFFNILENFKKKQKMLKFFKMFFWVFQKLFEKNQNIINFENLLKVAVSALGEPTLRAGIPNTWLNVTKIVKPV